MVEALKLLPERNRFMKGLFAWVGFRQIGVPYVRPERAAGTSSMGYLRLWRFALDGITSFSTAPLAGLVGDRPRQRGASRWSLAIGLIVRVLIVGREVPGYASLMVVVLFGFAIQMIAFGVLGEYVGRLYQEVKGRPIYVVRARVGFDRLMDRATYDRMRVLQEGHWWFRRPPQHPHRADRRARPAEAGPGPRGRLRAGRQPRHAAAASAR